MNMSKSQYFYFISGLPDISITDVSLPFKAKDFLVELKNKIEEKDFTLVSWLYYPRDNRNLLSILFSKNNMQQPEGCYSLQELKKGIEGNVKLPDYMNAFISSYKENKSRYTEAEWEDKLTEFYIREAVKTENNFLNKWMEFKMNLKNILLLLSNRKQALPFPEFILEANETAELLMQNPLADFSSETSLDFYNQAIKIMETENLVEREKKIDLLKWKKAEEMTFFNYFSIEAILSFIIRLMITERWALLKSEKDKVNLSSILNSIVDNVKYSS